MILDYGLYAVLLILSLGAILLNIISLPGNWIMLLAAVLFSWWTRWLHPNGLELGIILVVLMVGEVIEMLGSLVGAKKFGASTMAAWAAIGGGLIGGLLGFMLPVPLIGNLIGTLLGAFMAAWCIELLRQKPLKEATWAAVGAAFGRAMGMAAKIACGLIVWFVLVIFAFPRG